jgi:hypothetical protein
VPTGTTLACTGFSDSGNGSTKRLNEPPDAGPHVRWCGRGQGDPGPYPIPGTHDGACPTRGSPRPLPALVGFKV